MEVGRERRARNFKQPSYWLTSRQSYIFDNQNATGKPRGLARVSRARSEDNNADGAGGYGVDLPLSLSQRATY